MSAPNSAAGAPATAFVDFYCADNLSDTLAAFRALAADAASIKTIPLPTLNTPGDAPSDPAVEAADASFQHSFPYLVIRHCCVDTRTANLWKVLDTKRTAPEYERSAAAALRGKTLFVVGCGPGGLRAAIEARLAGFTRVIVVDKRKRFSRNNVLHLWKFAIMDYMSLGAKVFFPRFCMGDFDHIAIRRLQLILLKVALLLGVEVYHSVEFRGLLYDKNIDRWVARTTPPLADVPKENSASYSSIVDANFVPSQEMNALIGADGENSQVAAMAGFDRKEFKARMALGITANFVNHKTRKDRAFEQFSLARYATQSWFAELEARFNIELETMTYFQDETHYFVITAIGKNLLERGILLRDSKDTTELVDRSNVSHEELVRYIMQFAEFIGLPEPRELALTPNGRHDVSLFDFTKKRKATAQYVIREAEAGCDTKEKLPIFLVGDALLEPFWPQGTGAARCSLSALDALWCLRLYFSRVIAGEMSEAQLREYSDTLYRQMSDTPASLKAITTSNPSYTCDPLTRYEALPPSCIPNLRSQPV